MPRPLLRLVVSNQPEQSFREKFWPAYPRKVSKADAEKAWMEIDPDDGLITIILKALDWQRRLTTEWHFWPYPATWLHKRRWEDEPPPHLRAQTAADDKAIAALNEQIAVTKRRDELMASGLTREQAREQIAKEKGWS